MAKAIKIMRRSIHALFQRYHSLASAAALLVFPFSAALLLSQTFTSSSSPIVQTLSFRLYSLFHAAGFPASSQFFKLLNLKLSQTIFSFLFTVAFFGLAKAAIIQTMLESPNTRIIIPSPCSLLRLYRLILPTHLFSSFLILSANAAVFSLLFLAFNTLDMFRLSSDNSIIALSAASAVLYSLVLVNTTAACSLATIVSAMENCSGYIPVLKAFVLIRGKEATAIILALPANLGMAAIEALFQYRLVRPYLRLGRFNVPAIGEAFLIAYIYSLLVVLDTIISCMLYRNCKSASWLSWEVGYDQSQEPAAVEEKGDLQA